MTQTKPRPITFLPVGAQIETVEGITLTGERWRVTYSKGTPWWKAALRACWHILGSAWTWQLYCWRTR